MDQVLARCGLAVHSARVYRNIVSLNTDQDLYDDLSDRHEDWVSAQTIEGQTKPNVFSSSSPIIDRPFEDAIWASAIDWPFKHWQRSRFSDGSFGVWYASQDALTTVFETVHHWCNGFLADAGFVRDGVATQRKVYSVQLNAALVDLRPAIAKFPQLVSPVDYSLCQSLGARLSREGHPGLVTLSARQPSGVNLAAFTPKVLSEPQLAFPVRYVVQDAKVRVERGGKLWQTLQTTTS